jgi:hypothetical protein
VLKEKYLGRDPSRLDFGKMQPVSLRIARKGNTTLRGVDIYRSYPSPYPLKSAKHHNPWKLREILRRGYNTRHLDGENRLQC